MKIDIRKVFFVCLMTSVMVACSKKQEHHQEESSLRDEWPEMESFHMVMAEAYHPYKDSTDLEPAKSLAENLAKESEKWEKAPLPSAVDNEEMKAKLGKLKTDSRALADQVKAGESNERIGASLTALHDSFHRIMEAWHEGKKARQ